MVVQDNAVLIEMIGEDASAGSMGFNVDLNSYEYYVSQTKEYIAEKLMSEGIQIPEEQDEDDEDGYDGILIRRII